MAGWSWGLGGAQFLKVLSPLGGHPGLAEAPAPANVALFCFSPPLPSPGFMSSH